LLFSGHNESEVPHGLLWLMGGCLEGF